MKEWILISLLGVSTALAAFTVFSRVSRRLVLGWLGVGFFQSAFFLVIGFELLALANLLFVVASATVLQLYSALFGTAAIQRAESVRMRRDWIYSLGTGATLFGILGFALSNSPSGSPLSPDLETPVFANELLTVFPELTWILGVILFLGIIVWATVGRPGWKKTRGGAS